VKARAAGPTRAAACPVSHAADQSVSSLIAASCCRRQRSQSQHTCPAHRRSSPFHSPPPPFHPSAGVVFTSIATGQPDFRPIVSSCSGRGERSPYFRTSLRSIYLFSLDRYDTPCCVPQTWSSTGCQPRCCYPTSRLLLLRPHVRYRHYTMKSKNSKR